LKYTKEQVAQATEYLHEYLKPGDKVYTILRQVSRSGMSRHISTVINTKDGGNYDITYLVARLLGERRHDDGGMVVGGCGMDMGFETVYRLGYALWPDGFACIGEKCRSNDHSNGMPRFTQYTAETCPGRPCSNECDHKGIPQVTHKDGGYALRQEWL
jgi:hypothetical protein